MKKKRQIKIWVLVVVILAIILVISGGITLYAHLHSINHQEVAYVESMVEKQQHLEEDFDLDGFTIDNAKVILNPYGNSPLTALIAFDTKEEVEVKVTIPGKDESTTYTHTFDQTKEHRLPIYGLYADTINQVKVEYEEEGNLVSKTIEIETEALPDDMIIPEDVYADKEKLGNDLYFYTPSSSGYTCAYDVNGDVR